MNTITRKLEWDSGHRVLGHEGKCRHIHGHRYIAEVTVSAEKLDSLGRVIDFSIIKKEIGEWIDYYWDHNLLLHPKDPLTKLWFTEGSGDLFGDRGPFIFSGNPTAENMARHLFQVSCVLLKKHSISVVKVRIYETPNSWADYSEDS